MLPLAQQIEKELAGWEEMSGGALADPTLAAMAIPAREVADCERWIWGPCQPRIWSEHSALLSLKENVSLQLAPQLEVPSGLSTGGLCVDEPHEQEMDPNLAKVPRLRKWLLNSVTLSHSLKPGHRVFFNGIKKIVTGSVRLFPTSFPLLSALLRPER